MEYRTLPRYLVVYAVYNNHMMSIGVIGLSGLLCLDVNIQ